MNLGDNKSQILAGILVFAFIGCNSGKTSNSAQSGSGGNSSPTTPASASVLNQDPIFCQNPPYNLDSPLPPCPAIPPNTCPQAQAMNSDGECVNYTCDSVTELSMPTDGSTLQIPERPAGTCGVCYAVQLLNAIPESASSLTPTHDLNVVSRNHDLNSGDPNNHWNPYLMGQASMNFELQGVRQVDLAGAADDSVPILVDNFTVIGIFPIGTVNPIQPGFYGAFGTSDSTTNFAGPGDVLIGSTPIQLVAFASGGTASVGPLNVSCQVSAHVPYTLDFRAEDCGVIRNLSNVYILFR